MVSRLSALPIATASHRLVDDTTTSGTISSGLNTDSATAVEECVASLVDVVVTQYEQATLPLAHKVYCGYTNTSYTKQPQLSNGKLLYHYNGQLLTKSDFPWAGSHTTSEFLLMKGIPFNYANHSQLWTDAVLLCSHLISTRKQCALKKFGVLHVMNECRRLLYSSPMPMDYMYFDPHNRSEVRNVLLVLLLCCSVTCRSVYAVLTPSCFTFYTG